MSVLRLIYVIASGTGHYLGFAGALRVGKGLTQGQPSDKHTKNEGFLWITFITDSLLGSRLVMFQ